MTAQNKRGAPEVLAYREQADPIVSLKDKGAKAAAEKQWDLLDAFWDRWFVDQGQFRAAFCAEILSVPLSSIPYYTAPKRPLMNARAIVADSNYRRLSDHVGVGRSDVTFRDADQVAWDAARQAMTAVGGAHIMSMSDASFRGVKEMIILHRKTLLDSIERCGLGEKLPLAQAVGGLSRSGFAAGSA
jgi:hypothetical protein